MGRIRALYWETEQARAAVMLIKCRNFPACPPDLRTDRQTDTRYKAKQTERRADRQAGNSAMRLRTVKLSANKSLSKRELSGSIFFLLSAFEIRRTENQRRQPDGTFIRNLTPPVAQKSGQSSSFIVSGTKILTVTAFIRRKGKNVYKFERGRWQRGDNNATGHGIYVISVQSC